MKSYLIKLKLIIGKELKKIKYLVFATIIIGLLDTLGIGLIGPYALLILDDEFHGLVSNYISNNFDIYFTKSSLVVFSSLFIISLFFVKSFVSFLLQKKIVSFSYSILHLLRKKLIYKFQHIALSNLKDKKISNLLQLINNHTTIFTNNTLTPIIRIFSETIILIFILLFLGYTNFYALLLIAFIFFLVSIIFLLLIKKNIDISAKISVISSEKVTKNIIDFIQGFNEIRTFNKSKFFLDRFDESSKQYTNQASYYATIQLMPRYILEISLIVYICLFILLGHFLKIESSALVYDISIFFAASIRILPSLNQIIGNANHIRYSKKHLNDLYLELTKDDISNEINFNTITENDEFKFETIEFKNVSFKFDSNSKNIIENLSFKIKCGQNVNIFGRSGTGKTTLINLIMGLLKPSSGLIFINGKKIENTEANLQNKISYIPQDFYLFDTTIRNNITFFENEEEFDKEKFNDSLINANIYEHIQSLSSKENSQVGDNATKLSGGQKQRIAIARSLYFDREIIIIDEGTSSLDIENEKHIISSLNSLKNKTKIIISHSLEYKDLFDNIINLENKNESKQI